MPQSYLRGLRKEVEGGNGTAGGVLSLILQVDGA